MISYPHAFGVSVYGNNDNIKKRHDRKKHTDAAVPQLGINSVAGRPVALFPRPVVPFLFSVTPCLFVNWSALYRQVSSIRINQFHADLCLLPWGIYACVSIKCTNHHPYQLLSQARRNVEASHCVPEPLCTRNCYVITA